MNVGGGTNENRQTPAVRLREQRHNLKEGLLEKSKLTQYAHEESWGVACDDPEILEIESNGRYTNTRSLPTWHAYAV
jgi:hypothetical protein